MASCGNSSAVVIEIPGQGTKEKKFISNKIIPAVCALLNSDGGMIKIIDIALDLRSIEQMVIDLIGVSALHAYVRFKEEDIATDDYKILIKVKKSEQFVTVKYNLCLPTQKQIPVVGTTDYICLIRRLLQRNIVEDFVANGSHQKVFVVQEQSKLHESDVVQLKHLTITCEKEKKTCKNEKKGNTFAARMVGQSNKFCNYISGFANHRGGHIYYGINDKGVVMGERLKKEDIDEVQKKVSNAINKLIWTEMRITPKQGVHWEIYFEKVKDKDGKEVDSTYIVVVFVAFCRGGVFTAEPESYYIQEKKVNLLKSHLIISFSFSVSVRL